MLKYAHALNTVLAGLLIVPALTSQSGRARSLEQALGETTRALEFLAGLDVQAQAGSRPGYLVMRDCTEAAIADAPARDGLFVSLRDDVNRLQTVFDEVSSHTRAPVAASQAHITSGLDQETRALFENQPLESQSLNGHPEDRAPVDASQSAARGATAAASTESIEPENFSADPMRQALACYRAGRPAQCLELLKLAGDDIRATYWSARAFEALDRIDEAAAAYERVAKSPNAGYLARRATSDLEFVGWKRAHAVARIDSNARPNSREAP